MTPEEEAQREADYRAYTWPYESEENFLATITPMLDGTNPVVIWLIPHKGIGPGPTLDYAARRYLSKLTTDGKLVAQFLSLSPHEQWEVRLPGEAPAAPEAPQQAGEPVPAQEPTQPAEATPEPPQTQPEA